MSRVSDVQYCICVNYSAVTVYLTVSIISGRVHAPTFRFLNALAWKTIL